MHKRSLDFLLCSLHSRLPSGWQTKQKSTEVERSSRLSARTRRMVISEKPQMLLCGVTYGLIAYGFGSVTCSTSVIMRRRPATSPGRGLEDIQLRFESRRSRCIGEHRAEKK